MQFLLVAPLLALALAPVHAQITFEPTWQPPSYDDVRSGVETWLDDAEDGASLDAETAEQIRRRWPAEAPAESSDDSLLDRLAESFAAASEPAAELVRRCGAAYDGPLPPDAAWLAETDVPTFMRNNLRLFYARWLAQHGLYDEALQQLADLRPADVVDPASLLFYRMAALHQLVRPEEARAALAQLLEHEDRLPRRFQQVAQLVGRDLSALEDESLDHIARRMSDICRRLGYGRAGERVQEIENGVVKSLDKKIDDLEKQQQQQSASAGASGGAQGSSKPMQDSQIGRIKPPPMQVDRRDIGHETGWGDLPPKEREQALQQIGREYPAHYRELIEQYFRELANEPARN